MFEHVGKAAADVYGYRLEDWFGPFQARGYKTYDPSTGPLRRSTGTPSACPGLIAVKQAENLRFVEERLPLEIAGIYSRLRASAAT